MYLTKTTGIIGARTRTNLAPRLSPMAMMNGSATCDGEGGTDNLDDVHGRTARQIARMCGEVLRGSRPMARLRRHSSSAAFIEFSKTCSLLRAELRRDGRVCVVHVSRVCVGCDESTEIVVTVRAGSIVRALAMQAQYRAFGQWWLTRCHLVGGY